MTFELSCTVCLFERELESLAVAFDLEAEHRDEWGDAHVIEILRCDK